MDVRAQNYEKAGHLPTPDVLVIGGGVNGVALFRELALNGLSAILVDQSDFCRGATSASTRLAHGGLRYLENREFSLVAEAAVERNRLLRHAPHFAIPLEFIVPLESYTSGFVSSALRFLGIETGRRTRFSLASIEAALLLYERLGRVDEILPKHKRRIGRSKLPAGLNKRYKAAVSYFDGRIVNPEGLVFEMLEEALASNPQTAALNYADWTFQGGVVAITDNIRGTAAEIRPKLIVNAGGAWVDDINARLGLKTDYVLPVKGAHLVIKNDRLLLRLDKRAFYFSGADGRMIICCPLDDTVLMGTTEIPSDNASDRSVTEDEIGYMLDSLNRLFEDIRVTRDEIVHLTSGMRPLWNNGGGDVNRANRAHAIFDDKLAGTGMHILSLVGGKWTTFRSFAEQAADKAFRILGRSRMISTRDRDYPGTDTTCRFEPEDARAQNLWRRYGSGAEAVRNFCADAPDAALKTLPDFTRREILWLAEARAAVNVEDVVTRRTQLAIDGRVSRSVLEEIAGILAHYHGNDRGWCKDQVEAYLDVFVRPGTAR